MANAIEHAEIVLSAIIPARADLLDSALTKLSDEHFLDEIHRKLFLALERYYRSTAQVIPEHYLSDILDSKVDATKKLLYLETYRKFLSASVSDAEFLWSLDQLRELEAARATGEAITTGMSILRSGLTLPNGVTLRGAQDAREYLSSELSGIDKILNVQAAPEGDMRNEVDEILGSYAEVKRARLEGSHEGIRFGIPELDNKVGGMHNGELTLVAGFSSDGKSSLAVQAAWNASVMQGKNVLFLTTETLRPQIIRKLVARHSRRSMFELPYGLNTRDLKAGTLSTDQEDKLREVTHELSSNPAYGHIYVAQVPRSSSISSIEQTMYRVQKSFEVEFVVMDYLALLKSDARRSTSREELAEIIKEAKQVCTTFDGGRGVPFLSPWQVTRQAREIAERNGMYSSASLSETAEATNSADIIVSLLAPTDNTERTAEVTMQVLKNRDGETANGIIVEVDYATSHFQGRAGFAPAAGANRGSSGGGLGSLLE